VIDETSKNALVVDPVEPAKLLAAAEAEGVTVKGILTTHAHWDHAGGNAEFVKACEGITVYGGKRESDYWLVAFRWQAAPPALMLV
jgi:hydroxyacylglutathione hydrolase